MTNYGVIDLGSNSIRLAIYDVKGNPEGIYTNKDFKSLMNDKVMAGLAAYVINGEFTSDGINRAVSVLKNHMKRAKYFKCKKLEVFATAVLRNATNCNEAVEEIEQRTGLTIALLSEQDEAHLGFMGATCDRFVEQGTLIDIGGGSTELTSILNNEDFNDTSLDQGSLSSFALHVQSIIPSDQEITTIQEAFQARLKSLPSLNIYQTKVLYGIGGSVRAAAKLKAQADGSLIRPKVMTKQDIHEILEWCRHDSNTLGHAALKASAERVHTLIPGCVILHTLFEELGAEQIEICKYGVREGYLLERMLKQTHVKEESLSHDIEELS